MDSLSHLSEAYIRLVAAVILLGGAWVILQIWGIEADRGVGAALCFTMGGFVLAMSFYSFRGWFMNTFRRKDRPHA